MRFTCGGRVRPDPGPNGGDDVGTGNAAVTGAVVPGSAGADATASSNGLNDLSHPAAPTGHLPAGTAPSQPPTIYDVARVAGMSIASVSRVLNGRRNPRPETRDRVLQAVAELGFVPDSAARALSARQKEVVGVVVRRPPWHDSDMFADEAENLQFPDMINRGMEIVAQRHGFDLLIRSVGLDEPDPA